MTANTVNKLYEHLRPEERFRLILAAAGRGDTAEEDRLVSSSRSVTFSMRDFAPWWRAFEHVATLFFLELIETASEQQDYFQADDSFKSRPATKRKKNHDTDEDDRISAKQVKILDSAWAQGFILKTKMAGWRLFCKRLNVPPFEVWQTLPGYKRLKRSLFAVEGFGDFPGVAACKGMLRFLKEIRPKGSPEPTLEKLVTAKAYATELDKLFREQVRKCGG